MSRLKEIELPPSIQKENDKLVDILFSIDDEEDIDIKTIVDRYASDEYKDFFYAYKDLIESDSD